MNAQQFTRCEDCGTLVRISALSTHRLVTGCNGIVTPIAPLGVKRTG